MLRIRRLWSWLVIAALVAGTPVHAGVLEALSRGAYFLSNGTCPGYDNSAAGRALNRAADSCGPYGQMASVQRQGIELAQISNLALGSPEDRFFALLAKQHSRELGCAGSFTDSVTSGNGAVLDNLATKIRLMREAKLTLNQAAQDLEMDTDVMAKVCPSTIAELQPDPNLVGATDRHYEYCKTILTSRIAYQTILNSIPMANMPALSSLLDEYANLRDGPGFNTFDAQLSSKIQSAYRQTKTQLAQEAEKLDHIVDTQGGGGFSRSQRYALLSDPRVISKIIQSGGEDPNLKGLACQADAAYGQGADALSLDLMVGSIAFSGGAGILARVGSLGFKIAEGAATARAAGLISINATRVLQLSALGVNSVSAYAMIDKSCLNQDRISSQAQGTNDGGQCVSAPTVQQLAQDSCILDVSLAALSFAAVVPRQQVRALLGKLRAGTRATATVADNAVSPQRPKATRPGFIRNFFAPLAVPKTVASAKVAAQTVRDERALQAMGATFHSTDDATYLRWNVRESGETALADPLGANPNYGSILQIDKLPPPGTATGSGTRALVHPEMAEYNRRLEAYGYKLTVDTSLPFTGAGAYEDGTAKIVALSPNSSWLDFRHEFQHVEFSHFIEPKFYNLQETVINGASLAQTLPAGEVQALGAARVQRLQALMAKGLPSLAVNEALSMDEELKLIGFRRYIPLTGSNAERYALRHQITELNAITEQGIELSQTQARSLSGAKLRYAQILATDTAGATVIAGGAVATGVGIAYTAHRAVGGRDPSSYRQIIYDEKNHALGQRADGTWVYLQEP